MGITNANRPPARRVQPNKPTPETPKVIVQLVGRDGKILGKLNRKFLFYEQVPGVELLVDDKKSESAAAVVAFPWLLKLSDFVYQIARRTDGSDPVVKEARDLIEKMTQPLMPAGEKIPWESPEAP